MIENLLNAQYSTNVEVAYAKAYAMLTRAYAQRTVPAAVYPAGRPFHLRGKLTQAYASLRTPHELEIEYQVRKCFAFFTLYAFCTVHLRGTLTRSLRELTQRARQ